MLEADAIGIVPSSNFYGKVPLGTYLPCPRWLF